MLYEPHNGRPRQHSLPLQDYHESMSLYYRFLHDPILALHQHQPFKLEHNNCWKAEHQLLQIVVEGIATTNMNFKNKN